MHKTHRAITDLGASAASAPRHGPKKSTLNYGAGGTVPQLHRALEQIGYAKQSESGHPRYHRGDRARFHTYVHPDGHRVVVTRNDHDQGVRSSEAVLKRIVPQPKKTASDRTVRLNSEKAPSSGGAASRFSDQARARAAISSSGTRGMRRTSTVEGVHHDTSRYVPNTDEWRGHRPRLEQLHNRMGIVGYDHVGDHNGVSRYAHPEGHRVSLQHDGEHVSVIEHHEHHEPRRIDGSAAKMPRSRTTGPALDTRYAPRRRS